VAGCRTAATRWRTGASALAAATLITGITSAHLWAQSSVAVTPTGEGAALSIAGRL
jgi:hypothetical protein